MTENFTNFTAENLKRNFVPIFIFNPAVISLQSNFLQSMEKGNDIFLIISKGFKEFKVAKLFPF